MSLQQIYPVQSQRQLGSKRAETTSNKKRHGKPAGRRSFYGILFANGVKHPLCSICAMHITTDSYTGLPAAPQVKIVRFLQQITILEFVVSWCIAYASRVRIRNSHRTASHASKADSIELMGKRPLGNRGQTRHR